MENIEPQLLGVLIGSSVTLFASIVVLIFTNKGHNKRQIIQHQHELKISDARFYREKIEDIYLSFSYWDRNFVSLYLGFIGYVKGELSEKEASDFAMKHGDNESGNHLDKVEMFIALYFPNLNSKFQEIMNARSDVIKYFPFSRPSLVGNISDYYAAQKNFEKKVMEFKDELKAEINNL